MSADIIAVEFRRNSTDVLQCSKGGGGDGMGPQIAKLESDVENIKVTLADIKGDTRTMLWAGVSAAAVLLFALGGSYVKLSDRMDGQFSKVDDRFERVDQRFEAVDTKLDSMKDDIHRIELNVQRIADAVAREPSPPPPKR